MRCTHPRTVGFLADGKTLAWSQKNRSKEYASFQLPCGKCIECRLQYARDWATRCLHEATLHKKNVFLTLTYNDDHIGDGRLWYRDFQLFMKKLRKKNGDQKLSFIVCGEYGETTKRAHWHAIIFNFFPADAKLHRETHAGEQVYVSETLEKTWGKGHIEIGSVTQQSAGYVARYSAKKLAHGEEADLYKPIFKTSGKPAIGARWLEKNYLNVFSYGRLLLPDGTQSSIPRYYTKWLKDHQPGEYLRYISKPKVDAQERAIARAKKEEAAYVKTFYSSDGRIRTPKTRNQTRAELAKIRHEQLQQKLKLR